MSPVLRIDIGRLLSRARFTTPTGIDRVERAYARHFLESPRCVEFIARVPGFGDFVLPAEGFSRFLDRLERQWRRGVPDLGWQNVLALLLRSKPCKSRANATTIIPSHLHLDHQSRLESRGRNGPLLLFVHDCIPSDFPEYARTGGAARHQQRLQNALRIADAVIVNSQYTADRLMSYADAGSQSPPVTVAHIGLDRLSEAAHAQPDVAPYFVVLGTIEPRKNHLLLLHIWRQWALAGMQDIPKLIIAGKRGWENENIIDLLDRCSALQGWVFERNEMGDDELASLVRGARALLMPSFAEGFGMPVAEALAAGVPVIASDLPVFRELAGNVPDYLHPLDGSGWAQAILAYAAPDSVVRQQQLLRLKRWRPVEWDTHFAVVEEIIDGLRP